MLKYKMGMDIKVGERIAVPNDDVLARFCEDDVSRDIYPRQKEWQCRLPIQEGLRLFLQLFPLELPPNFSGQTTTLSMRKTVIANHKDILRLSENSMKNLLAIAEANRIKYVFIRPLASSERLPLLNIDFVASTKNSVSPNDYICQDISLNGTKTS